MCYLFYSVYTYCVSQYLYVDGVCKMFNTVFGNVDTMLAVVNGTRGLTEKGDCYAGETGIDSSSEIRKLKKKLLLQSLHLLLFFQVLPPPLLRRLLLLLPLQIQKLTHHL